MNIKCERLGGTVRLRKTGYLPSNRSSEWSGDLVRSLQYLWRFLRSQGTGERNDEGAGEKSSFCLGEPGGLLRGSSMDCGPRCMRKGPGITALVRHLLCILRHVQPSGEAGGEQAVCLTGGGASRRKR